METNRLYHTDCMEMLSTMGDNVVNLTLTDIPYAEVTRKDNKLRSLDKGAADIMTFNLGDFLSEVYRVTKGNIVIFCGRKQFSEIYSFFEEKQLKELGSVCQLIWEKTNPVRRNGEYVYLSSVENAVWFKKKGGVFNAANKSCVLRHGNGSSKPHPTTKNKKLLKELIQDSSNPGDIVFDPCAGSGSTLLAARELGRRYIGIELDTDFYNDTAKRLGV